MAISALSKTHMTKTVKELTHEGYHDPVIDYGSMVPAFKEIIPTDKFGFFYGVSLQYGRVPGYSLTQSSFFCLF